MQRLMMVAGAGALAALAVGCAGGHTQIVARTATVPISLSEGVRGPDGELVPEAAREKVGEFAYDYLAWNMFWQAIPLTGTRDISDEINQQVKAAGGEAVINLEVTSDNCTTWNAWTIVSIFPGCTRTILRGDIIRRRGAAPAPAGKVAVSPSAGKVTR